VEDPASGPESQASPRGEGEQGHASPPGVRVSFADFLTLLRLPLAVVFVALPDALVRLAVLALAAATDLLDGFLARRFGSSRFGSFIDPVADKLFMASGFLVVLLSGRLAWYEIVGVLFRDLVATGAFVVTAISGRAMAIPARLGGKAVTVAQVLTLVAFVSGSPLIRPLAWATAAIALYAVWDYNQAASRAKRPVGGGAGGGGGGGGSEA
jgi:CDP-diacylglycerol---glycerol-3-phosphate 3-phosphatidyltransferase